MKNLQVRDIIEQCNGKLISGNANIKCVDFCTDTRKIKKDDTYVGINEGCFVNKNKFEEKLGDRVLGVNSFFDNLIKSVKEYYGV